MTERPRSPDSNANQLLVSNVLRDGEVDKNVVTRFVSKTAPVAGSYTPINADFEGKLTLLGYHLDKNVVSRGEEFTIKLFFQVKAPLGRAYKKKLFPRLFGFFLPEKDWT